MFLFLKERWGHFFFFLLAFSMQEMIFIKYVFSWKSLSLEAEQTSENIKPLFGKGWLSCLTLNGGSLNVAGPKNS